MSALGHLLRDLIQNRLLWSKQNCVTRKRGSALQSSFPSFSGHPVPPQAGGLASPGGLTAPGSRAGGATAAATASQPQPPSQACFSGGMEIRVQTLLPVAGTAQEERLALSTVCADSQLIPRLPGPSHQVDVGGADGGWGISPPQQRVLIKGQEEYSERTCRLQDTVPAVKAHVSSGTRHRAPLGVGRWLRVSSGDVKSGF